MENYCIFCMREIKVSGLILPLVLGIKVTLFPWTPDRWATSKQMAQASDSSEETFVNFTKQLLKEKGTRKQSNKR